MNGKRFSLRFNLDNAEDRRAWEYLEQGEVAVKNAAIIQAINFKHDYANLVNLIQKTIQDALTAELPNIRTEPAMNAEPDNESIVEEFLALF